MRLNFAGSSKTWRSRSRALVDTLRGSIIIVKQNWRTREFVSLSTTPRAMDLLINFIGKHSRYFEPLKAAAPWLNGTVAYTSLPVINALWSIPVMRVKVEDGKNHSIDYPRRSNKTSPPSPQSRSTKSSPYPWILSEFLSWTLLSFFRYFFACVKSIYFNV